MFSPRSLAHPIVLMLLLVVPVVAQAATISSTFMLANARGAWTYNGPIGPAPPPPGLDPNSAPFTVSGLSTNDVVVLDFSASPMRVSQTQSGSQTADCTANTITLTATGSSVVFNPSVTGRNESTVANVSVYVNSGLVGTVICRSMDLVCEVSGPAKVTAFDFNMFRQHFLSGQPFYGQPACNYTNAPTCTISDLNLFRAEYLCNSTTGVPTGTGCTQTQCPICP